MGDRCDEAHSTFNEAGFTVNTGYDVNMSPSLLDDDLVRLEDIGANVGSCNQFDVVDKVVGVEDLAKGIVLMYFCNSYQLHFFSIFLVLDARRC